MTLLCIMHIFLSAQTVCTTYTHLVLLIYVCIQVVLYSRMSSFLFFLRISSFNVESSDFISELVYAIKCCATSVYMKMSIACSLQLLIHVFSLVLKPQVFSTCSQCPFFIRQFGADLKPEIQHSLYFFIQFGEDLP